MTHRLNTLILGLAAAVAPLYAQEAVDSISDIELSGVTVTASNIKTIDHGLSAIPTARERKVSVDGYGLLVNMHIPILKIDQITRSVKLNTGEEVRYFVNGVPASFKEVVGMRSKDVVRVEVLRRPTDPVYAGAAAVVNFVVKEYKYGGYTTLSADQKFFRSEGNYSVYTKYKSDKWTYQLFGDAGYRNIHGGYGDDLKEYSFDTDDGPVEIKRLTFYKSLAWKQKTASGAFRALRRDSNGGYIAIGAGLSFDDYPSNSKLNTTQLNDGPEFTNFTDKKERSMTPYVNVKWYKVLPKSWVLYMTGGLTASFGRQSNLYISPELELDNRAKERAFTPAISASLSKTFPKGNRFSVSVSGSSDIFHTDYTGATAYSQDMVSSTLWFVTSYSQQLGEAWSMSLGAYLPVSLLKISGEDMMTDATPEFNLSVYGNVGTKHSFSLSASSTQSGRWLTAYNDYDRQDNETEGSAGNSKLKQMYFLMGAFSYTYLCTNQFYMSLTANWDHRFNSLLNGLSYSNGVVYNSMVNSGYYDEVSIGFSPTLRLFSSKLSISPSVSANHFRQTGLYPLDFWSVNESVSVTYLPTDHLSFSAYFSNFGATAYKGYGGKSDTDNVSFMLRGTYTNGNFSATVAGSPFYKYSPRTHTLTGEHIRQVSRDCSTFGHRYVSLNLRYTFDYGKKLSRGNELRVEGTRKNSMM